MAKHESGPVVVGAAGTTPTVTGNGIEIVSGDLLLDAGNIVLTSGQITQTAGYQSMSTSAITAGTTQTQAGATAVTTTVSMVTVGTANDGIVLPPMKKGYVLIISNLSANAGKIYGNGTETLDGTAGNAGSVALTASKTRIIVATADGVSVSLSATA